MENTVLATPEESRPGQASATLLRLLGVLILLGGLYSAYQVLERAWILFENHDSVVRFGDEIEKHSHLNTFVSQFGIVVDFINKAKAAMAENQNQNQTGGYSRPSAPSPAPAAAPSEPLNASYFLAWTLSLILLGLIGKISFWAITAGGKLALFSLDHERQLRMVLRELIGELRAERGR